MSHRLGCACYTEEPGAYSCAADCSACSCQRGETADVLAEREACALIADRIDSEVHAGEVEPMDAAEAIAATIRERSER